MLIHIPTWPLLNILEVTGWDCSWVGELAYPAKGPGFIWRWNELISLKTEAFLCLEVLHVLLCLVSNTFFFFVEPGSVLVSVLPSGTLVSYDIPWDGSHDLLSLCLLLGKQLWFFNWSLVAFNVYCTPPVSGHHPSFFSFLYFCCFVSWSKTHDPPASVSRVTRITGVHPPGPLMSSFVKVECFELTVTPGRLRLSREVQAVTSPSSDTEVVKFLWVSGEAVALVTTGFVVNKVLKFISIMLQETSISFRSSSLWLCNKAFFSLTYLTC